MCLEPAGETECHLPDHDDLMAAALAWDDSARAYIAFQDGIDPNRALLLDPVMLEQCGDVSGRRVLDLGCGEGRFGRMLSARGAEVAGIDPTREMVQTARRRASGREAHVRAAAEALPFGNAAFEVVVSYVTLVDIVQYVEATAECGPSCGRADSSWLRISASRLRLTAGSAIAKDGGSFGGWIST